MDIFLTTCFIGLVILLVTGLFIYAIWEDIQDDLPGAGVKIRKDELTDAAAACSTYILLND